MTEPPSVFGSPLDVRRLFAPERAALLALMGALSEASWRAPTACPGWDVQDLVAHLLGDDLGRLARTRDGHAPPGPAPGEPLWVCIDPDALGEAVSWAAPGPAPVWLDAARDLSECWVHQQQLREAVGAPLLDDERLTRAVVDAYLRALPAALRTTAAPDGTWVEVEVRGPAGGTWSAVRRGGAWLQSQGPAPEAAATSAGLDVDTLWRLGSRGITPAQARRLAHVRGDQRLGDAALTLLAIIHP